MWETPTRRLTFQQQSRLHCDQFRQFTTLLNLGSLLPLSGASTAHTYNQSAQSICKLAKYKNRPFVPAPLRLQVFQSVHELSHPGTKATTKLVTQRFVWPGVQKDWRTWARACQACQRSKVSRHTVTPVGDFTLPAARFQHIHIDSVGPLTTSEGSTYCLTAVDRFTHRPEAITA
jgi:hypothetical protein